MKSSYAVKQINQTIWIKCWMPNQLGLQNKPTAFLQKSMTPTNECPGYETKQSNSKALGMLELWWIQSEEYPYIDITSRFTIRCY